MSSLGAAVAVPLSRSSGSNSKKVGMMIACARIGTHSADVSVAVFFVVLCMKRRRRLARQGHSKTCVPLSINDGISHTKGSKYSSGITTSAASNIGYRIPFAAVQEATNNFDELGGYWHMWFDKIYSGELSDDTKVAVKRGNHRSQQGLAEFRTEIEMLSQFRHHHLVSLIGYCDHEQNEMILIYEYTEKETLKCHMYDCMVRISQA
ncbi:hypothetical protein RIF29_31970 [Crotalaria pallida]|uniref:Serine-threonine/tyrosine-protein kinase catalytic domain-containing protein n=1 Tax=Crotalaria pallida TaxID=3830 RepID=A0AAN9I261_CROPI